MKRDLSLIKKILLKIEEIYINTPIKNLKIEGYSIEGIANHCELLYEEHLISKYKPYYADNQLELFLVGNLTNEGFNYLDSIRDAEELESHKHFNIMYNETNITAQKLINKNGVVGSNNNQKINKKTDLGLNLKLPEIKK